MNVFFSLDHLHSFADDCVALSDAATLQEAADLFEKKSLHASAFHSRTPTVVCIRIARYLDTRRQGFGYRKIGRIFEAMKSEDRAEMLASNIIA